MSSLFLQWQTLSSYLSICPPFCLFRIFFGVLLQDCLGSSRPVYISIHILEISCQIPLENYILQCNPNVPNLYMGLQWNCIAHFGRINIFTILNLPSHVCMYVHMLMGIWLCLYLSNGLYLSYMSLVHLLLILFLDIWCFVMLF